VGGMPIYDVAEMRYDRVIRSKAVEATGPAVAASEMNACEATSQRWARDWVRVTDEARGQVFAYTIVRRQNSAQPPSSEYKMLAGNGDQPAAGTSLGVQRAVGVGTQETAKG